MLPKAMQCFWVLASTHSFTRGLSRLGFANSFTTVPSKNMSSLKLCNDVLTTQIVKIPVLSATSLSMASEMVSTANNTEAETTTQNSIKSVEEIKSVTLSWVTSVIIGLNFCPFARKPFEDANLFVQVVQGSHEGDISDDYVNDVLATVMRESALLKEKKGTTIVVAPELYPENFFEYLDVLDMLEEALNVYELDEHVQIAPFHPMFEFSGSTSRGIDNLTNRSPYPMFHILREVEVSSAVDKLGGDSGKVWQRNISLLNKFKDELGREKTERIMRGEKVDGMEEIISKIRNEV